MTALRRFSLFNWPVASATANARQKYRLLASIAHMISGTERRYGP